MNSSRRTPYLRIGVDVGGTNTDGVILNPESTSNVGEGILSWHKTATTANPSAGIQQVLSHMIQESGIDSRDVASITIGTTHFVNAVVERDAARLSKVAVIRLCGPFSKHAPPCIDWPETMRSLVLGHYALLKGGLEVDGHLISDIDEDEIKAECAKIRDKGIKNVVINGVFSPIDTIEKQEERASAIVKAEIPSCNVVCSSHVANLGFLERENAAILNASILTFARRTIQSFQTPLRRLGLQCPVFIAQNDGTVLSGAMASELPIRTFSSGPTNSMRGAAFLTQSQFDGSVMIVDIGGTTTDVGILQENGFPRQQAVYSELSGVRMNFSCPDIKSIGLGGGSIVRKGPQVTIGPDSVGHRLTQEGIVFGGPTLTATDCAVFNDPGLDIGDRRLLHEDSHVAEAAKKTIHQSLETIIDTMKTSPKDIPVVLVGGGAVIAPNRIKGASVVLKPKWAGVANAIGAAMARVSAVIDMVKSTEKASTDEILLDLKNKAIDKAVAAGAKRETVDIVEVEVLPLQYIAHKTRFVIRAVGDFDFAGAATEIDPALDAEGLKLSDTDAWVKEPLKNKTIESEEAGPVVDISNYKPRVEDRLWYISETDLDWITSGCYVLGTGGGGSPYSSMLRLRSQLRKGAIIRIANPEDLDDSAQVGCGAGAGSPTVSIEKLSGDELLDSQRELFKICDRPATHMIPLEIGGANGLTGMIIGSSFAMDLPVVDGDWMGRAYPTKWQTTPVVFNERSPIWSPIAIADGNGNVLTMPKATSDAHVERILRAALSEMGSHVAGAESPVSGAETKRWAVEHTISQAWRIGRGVAKARAEKRTDRIAEAIIEECGGSRAGAVLWKGKIVGVERCLRKGHVYGECIIEGSSVRGDDSQSMDDEEGVFRGTIKIPFKNENIAAIKVREGAPQERQEDVLAIVPDLISVIDARNGEAIGTPEYRYGLLVVVVGIVASDKWTGSERGLKLGGPEAFGFEHLRYEPLGTFVQPKSVIDEYDIGG